MFHRYNLARVAIAKKDLATAKTEAGAFRKGAEAAKNAFQVKQAHELLGRTALKEKNYDAAIAELGQANQQNPDVFYLLGSLALKSVSNCFLCVLGVSVVRFAKNY